MTDILVKHSDPKVEILIHRGGAVEFHSFSRDEAKEIQAQLNKLLPSDTRQTVEFQIGTALDAEGVTVFNRTQRRSFN